MNKRLSHLLHTPWRLSAHHGQPTPQQMRRLLAVLLLVPGVLLVLSGGVALDVSQLAIGVLASTAGARLLKSRATRP